MVYGVELYVAPDGSDGNPGTKKKPLSSLVGARDAIRRQKGRGASVLKVPRR